MATAFESTGMTNNFFTLIVPDNIVSNLKPIANKININFPKNSNEEERVQKLFNEYRDGIVDLDKYGFVNGFLTMFNRPDIGGSSLVTALIMVIVYGGYFYATYTGYKSTVKNALK